MSDGTSSEAYDIFNLLALLLDIYLLMHYKQQQFDKLMMVHLQNCEFVAAELAELNIIFGTFA